MKPAQQHILDIAMAVRQAGNHPRQFASQFVRAQIKHPVRQTLRPGPGNAAGWLRVVGRHERPDDHAGRIGTQLNV